MQGLNHRTEKKKNAILKAAANLYKRYPPNKVGVRDIAKEANVSPVTIYNNFGSKDGLILELIKSIVGNQAEIYCTIFRSNSSFHEKIEALLFKQTQFFSDFHPEFINMLATDSAILSYLQETYQEPLTSMFLETVAQGKAEGSIDPEFPDSLIISVIQLFNRDINSKDSLLLSNNRITDIHKQCLEIITYGISGKRGLQ